MAGVSAAQIERLLTKYGARSLEELLPEPEADDTAGQLGSHEASTLLGVEEEFGLSSPQRFTSLARPNRPGSAPAKVLEGRIGEQRQELLVLDQSIEQATAQMLKVHNELQAVNARSKFLLLILKLLLQEMSGLDWLGDGARADLEAMHNDATEDAMEMEDEVGEAATAKAQHQAERNQKQEGEAGGAQTAGERAESISRWHGWRNHSATVLREAMQLGVDVEKHPELLHLVDELLSLRMQEGAELAHATTLAYERLLARIMRLKHSVWEEPEAGCIAWARGVSGRLETELKEHRVSIAPQLTSSAELQGLEDDADDTAEESAIIEYIASAEKKARERVADGFEDSLLEAEEGIGGDGAGHWASEMYSPLPLQPSPLQEQLTAMSPQEKEVLQEALYGAAQQQEEMQAVIRKLTQPAENLSPAGNGTPQRAKRQQQERQPQWRSEEEHAEFRHSLLAAPGCPDRNSARRLAFDAAAASSSKTVAAEEPTEVEDATGGDVLLTAPDAPAAVRPSQRYA